MMLKMALNFFTCLALLFSLSASDVLPQPLDSSTLPRPEYPRPQLARKSWLNLNGTWEFELDPGVSGEQRDFHLGAPYSKKILVPFCPESELSG